MDVRRLIQNALIAVSVAALSFSTFSHSNFPVPLSGVIPGMLMTFVFYHALTGKKSIHWSLLIAIVVIGAFTLLDLFLHHSHVFRIGYWEYPLLMVAVGTAIFYKPSLWGLAGVRGIREFAFLKPVTISFSWTLVSCVFPIILMQAQIGAFLGEMAERFLFILPLAVMSDFIDVEQEPGLNTIPRKLGLDKARMIIVVLFALHAGVVLWTRLPIYMILPDAMAAAWILRADGEYSFSKVLFVESLPLLYGVLMLI